jgi:hypothetical protein
MARAVGDGSAADWRPARGGGKASPNRASRGTHPAGAPSPRGQQAGRRKGKETRAEEPTARGRGGGDRRGRASPEGGERGVSPNRPQTAQRNQNSARRWARARLARPRSGPPSRRPGTNTGARRSTRGATRRASLPSAPVGFLPRYFRDGRRLAGRPPAGAFRLNKKTKLSFGFCVSRSIGACFGKNFRALSQKFSCTTEHAP